MSYNPDVMPQNLDEWNQLIDFRVAEASAAHEAEVGRILEQARLAHDAWPDSPDRPTLEEYLDQARAAIPGPPDRAYFERLYACYRPFDIPE